MDDFWGGSNNNTGTNSTSKDEPLDAALIDLVPIPPENRQNNQQQPDNSKEGEINDPFGDWF